MGRHTLQFFNLTQTPGQDLCLKIPLCSIYSSVIDRALPSLEHIGWREASKGACYTYIKHISESDKQRLDTLLQLLQQTLYLTRSEHLEPHFTTELDEAYAMGFNFQQGVEPLTYTPAGQLEHNAKELRHAPAIAELARVMADIIRYHPTLARVDIIAAVPPRPSKDFHLPTHLVNAIGINLPRAVGLQLSKAEVPKLKDLTLQQKISTLAGAFTLGESVQGKTILLVDDLYQSGTTLWSLARFLKQQGARAVYGLACVKSWRDTDNAS